MVRRLLFVLLLSSAPGFYFQEKDILFAAGPPRAPLSAEAAAFRDGTPAGLSRVVPGLRAAEGAHRSASSGCGRPADAGYSTGGEGDDGFLCGESPCPEPEDRGDRHPGAFSVVSATRDTVAGRGGPSASPKHGMGPVLSSLTNSLILSRPPPPATGRS